MAHGSESVPASLDKVEHQRIICTVALQALELMSDPRACKVLEILSEVAGDTMRPLIRELLPTLIELLASGNKVIQGYIGDCMVTIIQHTRFRGLPYIVEQATTNKSKDVRD